MVNRDPSELDEDVLPATDEPVDRETHDNLLIGVYSTDDDGVWKLEVRDWANRVVEATVYEKGRNEEEEKNGVTFTPLDTPDEMTHEAYLKEILSQRVEGIEEERRAVESK